MPIIKEFREFFLRNTPVNLGTKQDQESGFVVQYTINTANGLKTVYNRFLEEHFPSEDVYRKLFESITFKLNSEDKATSSEQGLVQLISDVNAKANSDDNATYTKVVLPHQLPTVKAIVNGNTIVEVPGITIPTFPTNVIEIAVDNSINTRNEFNVKVSDTLAAWFNPLVTNIKTYIDAQISSVISTITNNINSTNNIENLIFEIGDLRWITSIVNFDANGIGEVNTKRANWCLVHPNNNLWKTAMGLDPSVNFTDIDGRVLIIAGTKYTIGTMIGTDAVTLTVAQMPTHNHTASSGGSGSHSHRILSNEGGSDGNSGFDWDLSSARYLNANNANPVTEAAGTHTHEITIDYKGDGQSHPNIQPSIAYYLIVKYQ